MSHLRLSAIVTVAWLAAGCRDRSDSVTGPSPVTPKSAPLRPAVTAAAALSFWQLSAGENHTCGVTLDHRAYCWGTNVDGELGTGSIFEPDVSTLPIAVTGGLRFKAVASGRVYVRRNNR